ncbi:hypothetical protein JXA32_01045 [Candidatus Sumerlaeota bacterium]|nr:hypothetical protein [Candidatus Sumerlaeota bacterium]
MKRHKDGASAPQLEDKDGEIEKTIELLVSWLVQFRRVIMDKKKFDEIVKRLKEVSGVVESIPSEIREESFKLLKPYIMGSAAKIAPDREDEHEDHCTDDGSDEDFFGKFDHDKPANNVKLIAAYYYKEFGTDPFSIDEMKEKADSVGITLPARPDMTLTQAKDKSKKLFQKADKGKFKPTVHGEANLKSVYSVRKGTKKRQADTE